MNLTSALDPLLRFTRNRATPNLPSVLTPPFNPNAGSAVPATLEQARAAMPQVATPPNPATTPRPVVLPGPAPDMPVPAIKRPQTPFVADPNMTETRRVGAPIPEKQQVLPLAKLSSLPQPLPLEAPKNVDGTMLAARPDAPAAPLEVPKARSKFWDTLKGIGYGAMIGAAKNPQNPYAWLGGAATGGIATYKAPSNADLLQYEAITRPREQADALEQYQRDKMGNDIALGREKTVSEIEDRATKRATTEVARQREERLAQIEREKLELDKERLKLEKNKGQSIGAGGLYLPENQKVIPGTPRPQPDVPIREDVPAYRKATGEVVPNEYYVPRTERAPANDTQLNQDIDEFEKLKNDADTLGQQVKAAQGAGESEKVMDLSARFQGATNAMRAKAQQIQERHGGAIEVGGTDGWPYVKRTAASPRPRGAAPGRAPSAKGGGKGTFPSSRLEEYRKAQNLPSVEAARKQIEDYGYVIK